MYGYVYYMGMYTCACTNIYAYIQVYACVYVYIMHVYIFFVVKVDFNLHQAVESTSNL